MQRDFYRCFVPLFIRQFTPTVHERIRCFAAASSSSSLSLPSFLLLRLLERPQSSVGSRNCFRLSSSHEVLQRSKFQVLSLSSAQTSLDLVLGAKRRLFKDQPALFETITWRYSNSQAVWYAHYIHCGQNPQQLCSLAP